jgi:hypothetical protein
VIAGKGSEVYEDGLVPDVLICPVRFRTILKEKLYCSVGIIYMQKCQFCDKAYFSTARQSYCQRIIIHDIV